MPSRPTRSPAGSSGGEIRVEAKNNVALDTAAIFARGDFDASGGFGSGGMIGPLTPTVPPPGQAPIRAFLGALSWQNGVGDVRPTGAVSRRASAGRSICRRAPA